MSSSENARAKELLALSREAHWAFPTSSGRPVPADVPAWMNRLVSDRDAIAKAAVFFNDHGASGSAMELAANAWRVWIFVREDAQGRAFLASVLDRPAVAATRARALVLYGDGLFAFRLGDLTASRERNEAALQAARISNDREGEGLALLGLSRVDLSEGHYEQARKHAASSRTLLSIANGFNASFGQAPLGMLAQATRFAGTLDETVSLFEENLALNRRLDDRGMVIADLHNLGHVEMRRGNVDVAERYFEESARLSSEAGHNDDPYGQAMRLFNQATVAFARHNPERAATLLDGARSVLEKAKIELATDDQYEFDDLCRRMKQ